jgi:hypothetical protein
MKTLLIFFFACSVLLTIAQNRLPVELPEELRSRNVDFKKFEQIQENVELTTKDTVWVSLACGGKVFVGKGKIKAEIHIKRICPSTQTKVITVGLPAMYEGKRP